MKNYLIDSNSLSQNQDWEEISFFQVADHLPMGAVFLNQDFVVEKFNRHYAYYIDSYSPISIGEAKGCSYFSMVPGSDKLAEFDFKIVRENRVSINKTGAPLPVESDHNFKVTFWDINLIPIVNKNNKFKGILLITREVPQASISGSNNNENNRVPLTTPDDELNLILARDFKLSLREIQVASCIFNGDTSKEIADKQCVSIACIEFHRSNIRKKLGIKNTGINLSTFLLAQCRQ